MRRVTLVLLGIVIAGLMGCDDKQDDSDRWRAVSWHDYIVSEKEDRYYFHRGEFVKGVGDASWQRNEDAEPLEGLVLTGGLDNSYGLYSDVTVSINEWTPLPTRRYKDWLPDENRMVDFILNSGAETDISQKTVMLEYDAFYTAQHQWDRNSYVAIFRYQGAVDKSEKSIYLILQRPTTEDAWEIRIVKYPNDPDYESYGTGFDLSAHLLYQNRFPGTHPSTCEDFEVKPEKCFFWDNGVIRYDYNPLTTMQSSVFSETVKQYPHTTNFQESFDEEGNMHLFYTTENGVQGGDKGYVIYSFFRKEAPLEALYTQKVYVNRELY